MKFPWFTTIIYIGCIAFLVLFLAMCVAIVVMLARLL